MVTKPMVTKKIIMVARIPFIIEIIMVTKK